MRRISQIPLFVGFFVFVGVVIFSSSALTSKQYSQNPQSYATLSGITLSLQFVSPNLVSVAFNSEKDISGIDVVIAYDPHDITIYPHTVSPGPQFLTTTGSADEIEGSLSFSAASITTNNRAGIVATFRVDPHQGGSKKDTLLRFMRDKGQTVVTDKQTGANILKETQNVSIPL